MTRRRWIAWSAITALLFAAGLALLLWLMAGLVLYYAPRKEHLQPSDYDRIATNIPGGVEKLHLTSSDGIRIAAWYLPAALEPGAEHWAVILTHGGGDDKRFYLPFAEQLRQQGFDVMLPDLRGSGESQASPHGLTLGITEGRDVAAASAFLAERKHIRHIAAGGVSMGGVATVMAASLDPRIGPLIVESSSYQAQTVFDMLLSVLHFPRGGARWSVARALTSVGLWRMGASWPDVRAGTLPTLRLASGLAPRPTLFVFGDKDPFVNLPAVRRYAARFAGSNRIVVFPNTAHGIYPRHPTEYARLVTDFLNKWRRATVTAPSQ